MPGRFLSFEGIDGSGKSTQARLLADSLRGLGLGVVLTREPGGSPGAEEIRRLVLEGDPDRWSAETELLLFTAARRDHLEKTIRPALARGETVITDRFADSSRMYQGISRGDLAVTVDALHALMIGVEPDLTLLIDIDPEVGLSRSLKRLAAGQAAHAAATGAGNAVLQAAKAAQNAATLDHAANQIDKGAMPEDRFESFGPLFQARLRAGFLDLAARNPDRFRVIDGARPQAEVAADVLAAVRAHLGV